MLLCLEPHPILIFMGQEWASSSPFLFFTNHEGALGARIIEGRMREFPEDHDGARKGEPSNPEDVSAFARSKLNWNERRGQGHSQVLALYSACLRARRQWLAPHIQDDGAWTAVGEAGLVGIRYRLGSGDRLLLATFVEGRHSAAGLPESLRAQKGQQWRIALSSNDAEFGGPAAPLIGDVLLEGPGAVWLESETKAGNGA
jgi:maltooligosyltrehalose trehalohydrolase